MRHQAQRAGSEEPLSWGVSGGFRPESVPKDPAGNRTAEQIDDAVTGASYNNMNQLVSQQAGGALVFKGIVSEPAAMTVGAKPASVTADNRFEGQAVVPSGTGQVAVTAMDPSGNLRTNTYEVTQGATSKTFTYDANGNMTTDGTRTYEWDAENRLVAVKEGAATVASYTYNRDGVRTSNTVGGVTTTYVLEGYSVVEQRQSTGGVTKHFQGRRIDDMLATQDGVGTVSYLTRDHLGSIREHVSGAGDVELRRGYDPWGNLTFGAGTSGWAFTGREWDVIIGRMYHRARYYDPATARFMSEDPVRSSKTGSLYSYVENLPLIERDPSGLVRTNGCGKKRADAINDAARSAKDKVNAGCLPCGEDKQKWINKIDNATYNCDDYYAIGGLVACAGAWNLDHFSTGNDITIYGPSFWGWCGCRDGLVLHEIAHLVTGKEHPDDTVEKITKGCFPCAVTSAADVKP